MTSNDNLCQYKCNIIWQQIIAIDVKFNTLRNNNNFKILYIKRRNQLLRELSKKQLNAFRKQYLKTRSQLLSQKYGFTSDQLSINARNRHHRTNSNTSRLTSEDSFDQKNSDSRVNFEIDNIDDHFSPRFSLDLTNNLVPNSFSANYSFSGMHHIFDQHKEAVTSIKFANNDKSLLCCGSSDGTLSICQLTPSPATVVYTLKGHTAGVMAFEWSLSNDLIVSSSLDGSVKLWDAASGNCLRTITDCYGSAVMSCTFQPCNNNIVVTGNSTGHLQILNVSTGLYTKSGFFNIGEQILCLCFDKNGNMLWVGDSKGFISWFIFQMNSCRLILVNKTIVVAGCAITSLSCRTSANYENSQLLLLANSACNALLLFNVIRRDARLEIKHSFPIKHQNRELIIRSCFCPIITFREGICVVTGSEDTCVHFFSVDNDRYCKNKCVNKLQGHSAPVLDVCFNYDESLLASSDSTGNVIIWKREAII